MGNVAGMAEVCSHDNYCQCAQTVMENGSALAAGANARPLAWFALVVDQYKREQCEQMLTDLGYEYFSPSTGVVREWSDRQRRMQVPLSSGYIFCRFKPEKRLALLQIPGILGIVGSGKQVLEIDPNEVDAVRTALKSRLPLKPGPAAVAGQQSLLLLAVSMLNRGVSVEVGSYQLALPN